MSTSRFNEALQAHLVPPDLNQDALLTFNGRRMYRVVAMRPSPEDKDWLDLVVTPIPYFGMYGTLEADEEAYAEWVSSEGSDPWYDEILADTYELTVPGNHTYQVLVRYPSKAAMLYSLQVTAC